MSSRSFTKEEQAILKENRYTYSVSPNTISFTIEFKKEFWKRYQSGERPKDIVEALGYDYSLLGETRVSGLKGMSKKQALEGNFREGPHTSYAVSNHPDYSSMSDKQKFHAMEHELYYLRHENTIQHLHRRRGGLYGAGLAYPLQQLAHARTEEALPGVQRQLDPGHYGRV